MLNVILASASPRRQELLKRIFSKFEIKPADIDETVPEKIEKENAAEYLSRKKAEYLAAQYPNNLIIAADTIVVFQDKILGKPKSDEDAFEMLSTLSGETHKVITGCTIQIGNLCHSFSQESLVHFFPLTKEEIYAYIDSGEHQGKAGSYAIQGLGGLFVESIEGDYYNVVGLPIGKLNREIHNIMNRLEQQ